MSLGVLLTSAITLLVEKRAGNVELTGEELQVVDTEHINTPLYPFIGYFRVPYPD